MNFDNQTFVHDQAQSQRTSTIERHSRPIFYGWWVVLASAIGLFWGVPITVYSFSVFFEPLMQEFHAGRAAVSLAFTLKLITAALCAAPVGWLTDRYGARRVILTGTGIFGSILLANRLFSDSLIQFYCFYVLLGLSVGGVGPIPYGSLVSRWFDRLRGLALGLTMFGIGLGAVIMPSLAQALIARFGWKTAYSILGASALLISGPVVGCLIKEGPAELGLLADGRAAEPNTISEVVRGLTAQEAWRSRDFWLMVLAFTLVSASVQGCVVHMAPMLSDHNLGGQAAALGSSLIGAAVMIGRIGTGYLLDRILAARLASILFAVAASGIALLLLGSGPAVFAGAFLVGLGLGAEVDLNALPDQPIFWFGRLWQGVQLCIRCFRNRRRARSSHHGSRLRPNTVLQRTIGRISRCDGARSDSDESVGSVSFSSAATEGCVPMKQEIAQELRSKRRNQCL